jgi:hypothetical protein
MQVAENLASVGAQFRAQYGESIRRSGEQLQAAVDAARAVPPPSVSQPGDFASSIARQNLVDAIINRLDGHAQYARGLRLRASELLIQLEQNQTVRADIDSLLGDPQSLLELVRELGQKAGELDDSVARLRESVRQRQDAARSTADTAEQERLLAEAVPPADDDRIPTILRQTEEVAAQLDAIARPLDLAATPAYEESARSVAAIRETGPRNNITFLLVDSLTSVGRFRDARAAVALASTEQQRYALLAQVAESQGRRGLADEARAWIAREVPPQYRDRLNRHVQQGVLTSLEQARSRSASFATMGSAY